MIELPQGTEQLLWAICHDCRKKHPIRLSPGRKSDEMSDWWVKHEGHRVEFRQEDPLSLVDARSVLTNPWHTIRDWFRRLATKRVDRRAEASLPWLAYDPNTDDKTAYGSSAALTITLASLATSSTLVAGRESTAVSNTTNLYYDYLLGGYATVGTTPTANTQIEVWGYASEDDTPNYPSLVTTGLTGSDAAITAASRYFVTNAMNAISLMYVDTNTSDRKYSMAPLYIAPIFGGWVPKKWGIAVFHNTGVNFNATGGNHVFSHTGQYGTS